MISHYRILSQLGAGGMGVVYLAEDTKFWRLPLDGSRPVQLTNFTSDAIRPFACSRDGRQLALSRQHDPRRRADQ